MPKRDVRVLVDAGVSDIKKMLARDKAILRDLKKENSVLKKKARDLDKNNKVMADLIKVLEQRIRELKEDLQFTDKYVYSFEQGGWIERGSLDKKVVELKGFKKIEPGDINLQLQELLRLVKLHKGKLK